MRPCDSPANQKGREKAAPITLPAASADSVQTAVVPFQTSAKEAVPTRSASNRGPRGMSTSRVLPLTPTLALPPGGSLADLQGINYLRLVDKQLVTRFTCCRSVCTSVFATVGPTTFWSCTALCHITSCLNTRPAGALQGCCNAPSGYVFWSTPTLIRLDLDFACLHRVACPSYAP